MAIFLIKDRDTTNPDPEKDAGCYKRGDIVEVFEDDKPCVIPPAEPFWIIKISGITKAQAEKYIQSQTDNTNPEKPVMLKRRIYNIPISLVPQSVKNALQQNRYFETTWSQAKNFIQNKITLDTE